MKSKLTTSFRYLLTIGWFYLMYLGLSDNTPQTFYGRDGEYADEAFVESAIPDGRHSASVGYYNPDTGYNATYDLFVEVEGNEITTIYFENGGYLDSSHISPEDISDGTATVTDDRGRTFDIELTD